MRLLRQLLRRPAVTARYTTKLGYIPKQHLRFHSTICTQLLWEPNSLVLKREKLRYRELSLVCRSSGFARILDHHICRHEPSVDGEDGAIG